MLETYLDLLELDYFELGEAFKGLANENVWKRPADNMLSVGEIAAHICFAEAFRLGVGDRNAEGQVVLNPDNCRVNSPLVNSRFAYYPHILAAAPLEVLLAMTANDLFRELMRVHSETVAAFRASNPDLDSSVAIWGESITQKDNLRYMIFHVAYHTGQIYSTRHLLGEKTVDN